MISKDIGRPSLRVGELVLELAPEIGGAIAAFYQENQQGRFDWLRPASAQALEKRQVDGMASFPLIPFCNRLRNGRALFEGRTITLPANLWGSPHTLHGVGWHLPWQVEDSSHEHITLVLDCPASSCWPYHFLARQRFILSEQRLDVDIEVENRDEDTMPLGVGHHPYLLHRRGCILQTSVTHMWVTDQEMLPVRWEKNALIEQLSQGLCPHKIVVDNNFIGWNRQAIVTWPGAGREGNAACLSLTAASPLNYFVLYTPAEQDYFCIEPVSNCTDWLNWVNEAPSAVGGAILRPGTTYRATFSLDVTLDISDEHAFSDKH